MNTRALIQQNIGKDMNYKAYVNFTASKNLWFSMEMIPAVE